MSKTQSKGPSVFNWFCTLILFGIPVANLIFMILFAIFGKTPIKRRFAIAAILLEVIAALIVFAVFVIWPDKMLEFANIIRSGGIA